VGGPGRGRRAVQPFLDALLDAEQEGVLDRDAVCAHVLVLLFAGVETTQNLIANSVYTLLRSGCAAPYEADAVVEECLRYEPPVLGVLRRARERVTLRGEPLRAGDEMVVMLAAANRDGARFSCPEEFDPARTDRAHLGFGLGPHYCPGAALARLTTRVALETLASGCPGLALADADIAWRDHDPIVRGPKALPVTFTPR
jgi:cytochrome P450